MLLISLETIANDKLIILLNIDLLSTYNYLVDSVEPAKLVEIVK